MNNPIKYTDPTGHIPDDGNQGEENGKPPEDKNNNEEPNDPGNNGGCKRVAGDCEYIPSSPKTSPTGSPWTHFKNFFKRFANLFLDKRDKFVLEKTNYGLGTLLGEMPFAILATLLVGFGLLAIGIPGIIAASIAGGISSGLSFEVYSVLSDRRKGKPKEQENKNKYYHMKEGFLIGIVFGAITFGLGPLIGGVASSFGRPIGNNLSSFISSVLTGSQVGSVREQRYKNQFQAR